MFYIWREKKGGIKRQSNIEIARILAMFLILVIHANMVSLPRPSRFDLFVDPSEVIFRYFIESIGIISVNIFVFISGWFKIKPTSKKITSFIYQVVFFWGGMLILFAILGIKPLTLKGLASSFALTNGGDWFIKAYLVLCIIAPVLNQFIETSSKKLRKTVLLRVQK